MLHRKIILLTAKLGISALLLWLALTKVDVGGVAARVQSTDVLWLLPSLAIGPAVVILSAWRWQTLSLGLLGFGEAVRYTWIGLFFGSVMPGAIGGDVAKGVSLATRESRARDSRLPVSIVVDKLVGFWALLLLFSVVVLIVLARQPQLLAGMRSTLWMVGGATAAGLLAAAAICHPRGAGWFTMAAGWLPEGTFRVGARRILTAVGSYAGKATILIRAALISIALHGINAFSLWLVLHSLQIPASLGFALVYYPMLSVLLALPVSISGVGVRDVFSVAIFSAFGLNPESALAFSWLLLGLSIPNALLGGAIQLWELFRKRVPG